MLKKFWAIICLVFLFSVNSSFADSTDNLTEIQNQISQMRDELLIHHKLTSIESNYLTVIGIIVSLVLSTFASIQATIDQRKTKKFVQRERFLQEANLAYNTNDFENAKKAYDKALEKDPNDISILLMAGNSLSYLHRYDDAISYYDRILKIDPTYERALNNKGTVLAELGNHDTALEYYEKANEQNPNYADTLNNIGTSYLNHKKDYKKSLEYFDKSLRIEPKDILSLMNKAIALNNLKLFDDAESVCNLAILSQKGQPKLSPSIHVL